MRSPSSGRDDNSSFPYPATRGSGATAEESSWLFEDSSIPAWVSDLETGRFLRVNRAALQRYGYAREEFLALTIEGLRAPAGTRPLASETPAQPSGPLVVSGSWHHRGKDGAVFPVQLLAESITLSRRPALLALLLDRDREGTYEALQTRERRLAAAQTLAHIGSWELDIPTNHSTWSEELYRILGAPVELPGGYQEFMKRVHPEDRDEVARIDAEVLERRIPSFEYECRIVRPDGEIRHLLNRYAMSLDAEGLPVRMAGTALDITDQRRAEQALADSERRHREMIEHATDLVTVLTPEGVIEYMSPSVRRVLGYEPEELRGHNVFEIIEPNDAAIVVASMRNALSMSDEPILDEARFRHRDGTWRILQSIGHAREERGGVSRLVVNSRDVTDRRIAEEALFAEHERAQVTLRCIADGVACTDMSGNITFLNLVAETMTGWSSSEAAGLPMAQVVRIADPPGASLGNRHAPRAVEPSGDDGADPLLRAVRRGETISLANDTFRRTDGSTFAAEYSAAPMRDSKGTLLGAVIAMRDITERRAVERLKSEFVSTVSHELRTPLTSIRGALGLLGSGMLGALGEKGQRMLEIAVTNTDRLVRLINDILDIERIDSGRIELAYSLVDANGLLRQAIDGVQMMADSAGVELTLEPCHAQLRADSDRILQTLTNLLGNAIKFSPAGTRVTVSGLEAGGLLTVRVADQGRGIPDGKAKIIFERFKQVDASDSRDKGGSGLGLAISASIIKAHGGRIWTEKNGEQGSVFLFEIPLSGPSRAPALAPAAASGDAAGGELVVLIVEDDEDLYRVMSATLEARGIRTLHAASGREAIDQSLSHRPDLIVLDLVLPELDGYAVVDVLRGYEALKDIPLLVYSALEVSAEDQRRLTLGPTAFLTKSRGSLHEVEVGIIGLLDAAARSNVADVPSVLFIDGAAEARGRSRRANKAGSGE